MMQRWERNGVRNEAFVAMLSARALMVLAPNESPFAHGGTRPHRYRRSLRSPSLSSTIAGIASVGGTFQEGRTDSAIRGSKVALKNEAISGTEVASTNRPHMRPILGHAPRLAPHPSACAQPTRTAPRLAAGGSVEAGSSLW